MSGLPRISGKECVKALHKQGFYLKRREGSHMILRRDEPFGQVVVPDHESSTAVLFVQSFVNQGLAWMNLSSSCNSTFCFLLSDY